MEVTQKNIITLGSASLKESVAIIRSAFGEVIDDFGITESNTPMFAAFTTIEKLEEMKARGVKFFGLFLNGSQVGVVALEKEADGEYHMKRLAVLPEYWHSGLGRNLVDYVIDYVRKHGVKRLHLGMVNENIVLKKWYQDIGFKETEVIKFDHLPFTVCRMALEIE
jgi:diamine N-acetyltransferase